MKKKRKSTLYINKDKSIKVKAIANKNKIIYRRMAGRHKWWLDYIQMSKLLLQTALIW